ncbi:hypothetical protein AO265_16135, partial [Pseudomonas sp. ABAC61]
MSPNATEQKPASVTEQVLQHHLSAFAKGIDELMKDYTDSSAILTPTGNHVGLVQIREFFEAFLSFATPKFWAAFKVTSQVVYDDVAYLKWSAVPFVSMAT